MVMSFIDLYSMGDYLSLLEQFIIFFKSPFRPKHVREITARSNEVMQ